VTDASDASRAVLLERLSRSARGDSRHAPRRGPRVTTRASRPPGRLTVFVAAAPSETPEPLSARFRFPSRRRPFAQTTDAARTPFLPLLRPRSKHKAVHKTTSHDDKRLDSTVKRLGVQVIPGIEEVNIFQEDSVIHYTNPTVKGSIAANTYVISGNSSTKKLQDLLPGIINQLGPDNLENLKKLAAQYADADAVPDVKSFENAD
jgi:nascent polypeptide-associated complex subunit beta